MQSPCLEDFFSQLTFQKARPQDNCALDFQQPPQDWDLDWNNPHFGPWDRDLRQRLAALRPVPRMSTLTIAAIINVCVQNMPSDQCYLNVGTWFGFSLLAGMLGNPDKCCIGVDNFSQFAQAGQQKAFQACFESVRSPRHRFFNMDYRAYLKQHREPIGLYFYDGDHSYEQQLEGLLQAEALLAPGAIVLVDDTNWFYALQATRDFVEERPESFELLAHFPTMCNYHPSFWNGLTILRKRI